MIFQNYWQAQFLWCTTKACTAFTYGNRKNSSSKTHWSEIYLISWFRSPESSHILFIFKPCILSTINIHEKKNGATHFKISKMKSGVINVIHLVKMRTRRNVDKNLDLRKQCLPSVVTCAHWLLQSIRRDERAFLLSSLFNRLKKG